MYSHKYLIDGTFSILRDDGIQIPKDIKNRDFIAYSRWLKQGNTPEIIEVSDEEYLNNLRSQRDSILDSTSWVAERHRQEKELHFQTTLSDEEFTDWLQFWQELRDMPTTEVGVWLKEPVIGTTPEERRVLIQARKDKEASDVVSAQSVLNQAQSKLAQSEADLEELENEKLNKQNLISDLQSNLLEINESINTATAEASGEEAAIPAAELELSNAEEALAADEENSDLLFARDEAWDSLTTLKADLAISNDIIDSKTAELNECYESLSDLTAEISDLNERIDELEVTVGSDELAVQSAQQALDTEEEDVIE